MQKAGKWGRTVCVCCVTKEPVRQQLLRRVASWICWIPMKGPELDVLQHPTWRGPIYDACRCCCCRCCNRIGSSKYRVIVHCVFRTLVLATCLPLASCASLTSECVHASPKLPQLACVRLLTVCEVLTSSRLTCMFGLFTYMCPCASNTCCLCSVCLLRAQVAPCTAHRWYLTWSSVQGLHLGKSRPAACTHLCACLLLLGLWCVSRQLGWLQVPQVFV